MYKLFFACCLIMFFCACQKEILEPNSDQNNNTANVSFETDPGEIGFNVDGHPIAKRRVKVAEIEVLFEDSRFSKLNKRLTVDPYLQSQIFKWPRDMFNEEELKQLTDGTKVSITAFDELDRLVGEYANDAQILNDKGLVINLEPTIDAPEPISPNFNSNMAVLIQSRTDGKVLTYDGIANIGTEDWNEFSMRDFEYGSNHQQFFIELDENTGLYVIKMILNDKPGYIFSSTGIPSGSEKRVTYMKYIDQKVQCCIFFEIKATEEGFFTLRSVKGGPGYISNNGKEPNNQNRDLGEEDFQWRIIAANVDWNIEDLGTVFKDAILPPAKTDVAFSENIRNCANVTTNATIGVDRSMTQRFSTTQEESIQLYSANQSTYSISASVSASGKLFGAGVTATASAGFSKTMSNSVTNFNKNSLTEEQEETVEISFKRQITIGPYSAVIAYDAAQSYEYVRVPYVQRVRIRGRLPDRTVLDSDNIIAQLSTQYFDGVISNTGADFVEVTLRGFSELNSWVKRQTNIEDGEPCD